MSELYDVRISVSKELAEHYELILQRRNDLLNSSLAEDRDVVAIINATTSIIKELSRIQAELYNSEKFAVLQQIIIDELKSCDTELQMRVIEAIERRAEAV